MGDFAQMVVWLLYITLVLAKTLKQMEDDLSLFAGYRPMELILPSLYSELEALRLKKL